MTTANPYAAPAADDIGANLSTTYQPKVFAFSGRIGRLRYLAYSLAWGAVTGILAALIGMISSRLALATGPDGAVGIVSTLLGLFLIQVVAMVPMFALAVRRLNDLDKVGWWSLLLLVPLVNLGLAIYILFWPGTSGGNRFGPAPVVNSTGVVVAALLLPVLVAASILLMFAGVMGMAAEGDMGLDYDFEYYAE